MIFIFIYVPKGGAKVLKYF